MQKKARPISVCVCVVYMYVCVVYVCVRVRVCVCVQSIIRLRYNFVCGVNTHIATCTCQNNTSLLRAAVYNMLMRAF